MITDIFHCQHLVLYDYQLIYISKVMLRPLFPLSLSCESMIVLCHTFTHSVLWPSWWSALQCSLCYWDVCQGKNWWVCITMNINVTEMNTALTATDDNVWFMICCSHVHCTWDWICEKQSCHTAVVIATYIHAILQLWNLTLNAWRL